ncbi:hypothetical protein [Paenibacillus methanolicus]|uniref:Uncharacterized protein n=1 Tax=Paenibacillus methanolicus TaxID=582686 RepID=A0A5S5BPI9_9BACL|nr:hypothetical protein [Paenibacillus methanolicus]TYP68907.1 hypothetical protein BCM02_11725 [Paenibacillus methanolicus]
MIVKFAFYDCDNDDCLKRFAVEDVEGDEIEEPACNVCGSTTCSFLGTAAINMGEVRL